MAYFINRITHFYMTKLLLDLVLHISNGHLLFYSLHFFPLDIGHCKSCKLFSYALGNGSQLFHCGIPLSMLQLTCTSAFSVNHVKHKSKTTYYHHRFCFLMLILWWPLGIAWKVICLSGFFLLGRALLDFMQQDLQATCSLPQSNYWFRPPFSEISGLNYRREL
jgi:hypothetical protein